MRLLVSDGTADLPDAFARLPHLVRGDDPLWIPEEEHVLRRAFSAENPWFAHGRAIALCIPDRARLAVFRDTRVSIDGRPAAFFGCFESRADGAAVRTLLAEAERWAREQGAALLLGPVDFTTAGRYRLLTAAEPGAIPFPGEPDNPAWYPALLEEAGLRVVRRYLTQVGRIRAHALGAKSGARARLECDGYVFEPIDGERLLALLPQLHEAANAMFADAFAYAPPSYAEFAAGFGTTAARRLCPRTSLVAWGPAGDLAGFLLVYPHYGPLAVQGAIPAPVPASELSFDAHAARLGPPEQRTAVAKTIGVGPAHRGRGLMDALASTAIERGAAHYGRWMAATIREGNPSRSFGAPHAEHERHYALYGKSLAGPAEPAASRAG